MKLLLVLKQNLGNSTVRATKFWYIQPKDGLKRLILA